MGCSSEYKTVLRYPEFRKRFHRQILEGPVLKRDASCSLREWSKCQKVRFTFRFADGTVLAGRLSKFYTTNYKEWALRLC